MDMEIIARHHVCLICLLLCITVLLPDLKTNTVFKQVLISCNQIMLLHLLPYGKRKEEA